jgi:hypothetical protein
VAITAVPINSAIVAIDQQEENIDKGSGSGSATIATALVRLREELTVPTGHRYQHDQKRVTLTALR